MPYRSNEDDMDVTKKIKLELSQEELIKCIIEHPSISKYIHEISNGDCFEIWFDGRLLEEGIQIKLEWATDVIELGLPEGYKE